MRACVSNIDSKFNAVAGRSQSIPLVCCQHCVRRHVYEVSVVDVHACALDGEPDFASTAGSDNLAFQYKGDQVRGVCDCMLLLLLL
jgi:hypothetical protein